MNRAVISAAAAALVSGAAARAGDGYDLRWCTIDGGGLINAIGAGFSLGATAGQPDAGAVMSGGVYTLAGGFWGGGSAPCRADWNGDGLHNSQDFFDFMTSFFGENADFNFDGLTNSQDFFDYLVVFFGGC